MKTHEQFAKLITEKKADPVQQARDAITGTAVFPKDVTDKKAYIKELKRIAAAAQTEIKSVGG